MSANDFPDELHYTAEHEWVRELPDGTVRIGITSYAQDALGDVVFVTLPETGSEVTPGSACGEIESTKSVSDLFAPVAGTVTARNETLDANPEMVNTDPYGDGWMFEIRPGDPSSLEGLMDAAAYQAQLS